MGEVELCSLSHVWELEERKYVARVFLLTRSRWQMNIKMPHVRSSASPAKMQTKMSAWTPLNHPQSNYKVFEERRSLLSKWFDRWSDKQKRLVLHDFVKSCSKEQLRFVEACVSQQLPLRAADFTCLLPRAICLYIFSFLDPRSLCRCARVSWRWKSIVDLDQLWMPKCLRLGWIISFSPTVFEQGVWKRHYINTVQEILLAGPTRKAAMSQQRTASPDEVRVSSRSEDMTQGLSISGGLQVSTNRQVGGVCRSRLRKDNHPLVLPPWRDSDRAPKDTVRFNYLDNLEAVGQASAAQNKNRVTACTSKTEKPDNERRKTLSEMSYKLRKAKSLMFLTSNSRPHHPVPLPPPPLPRQTQSRPHWASVSYSYPTTKEEGEILLGDAQWNAGKRPGPVRTAVPRLSVEALRASRRSNRSLPSVPLFDFEPWTLPVSFTQYVD
ncbi:F-box only protein 16 [Syngnathoides biaculeatus]|uniref:F-box only protein 16 n=1 Tax=Syngnathoides biaculeatus TaxID=300417 RepID=UPI002ADE1DA7|nr:F-box only protein 16 [Syngnathoides biaculeatus]